MRQSMILVCCLIVVAVTACAPRAVVPLRQPAAMDGAALLYIYRPDNLSNIVISPNIIIDDMDAFALKNDSYTFLLLAPGSHKVRVQLGERYQGQHEWRFSASAGIRYYIRLDTRLKFRQNDLYERRFDLQPVGMPAAEDEMIGLKFFSLQQPTDEPSTERPEAEQSAPADDAQFSISKSRNPFGKNR